MPHPSWEAFVKLSILADVVHHIESSGGQPWGGGAGMGAVLAARSPAFLPDTVFENHYGLWIAGIALGALLIVVARSQAKKAALYAGQALLVLTLVWMLVARGFETKGERLYAVHQGMVAAAEKGDVDAIVGYFDKSFGGEVAGLELKPETVKEVLRGILKEANPKEIKITSYSHHFLPPTGAASTVSVYAKTDLYPGISTWSLSWDDVAGEDWRLVNVKPVSGGGAPH